MDCRTFRDNHATFIDDAMRDEQLVAMQRHLAECPACAGHDTTVRRAILLFRNMPTIEPSADFTERLYARLRDSRGARRPLPAARARGRRRGDRTPGLTIFTAFAAGLAAAAFLGVAASNHSSAPSTAGITGAPLTSDALTLAPIVALAASPAETRSHRITGSIRSLHGMRIFTDSGLADSEPESWAPLAGPAFAASVTSGMPIWPAAVLAARIPASMATGQLKLTSLRR